MGMVNPLEQLFGPSGAINVVPSTIEGMAEVECRNGLKNKITLLTVPLETGRKIQEWIRNGKPGLIQDVFPELTVEQREQMMSGITPEEWNEMWKDNEDE